MPWVTTRTLRVRGSYLEAGDALPEWIARDAGMRGVMLRMWPGCIQETESPVSALPQIAARAATPAEEDWERALAAAARFHDAPDAEEPGGEDEDLT